MHRFILPALCALPFTGCGPGWDQVALCESLMGTHGTTAVTAVASGDGPLLTPIGLRRYQVSLVAVSGGSGHSGRVRYERSTSVRNYFFLRPAVPFRIEDAAGGTVTTDDCPSNVETCSSGCRTAHLPAGTYHLVFGTTSETSLAFTFRTD
jgi:hypothetical protein